jgi:hypothetical protein
MSHMERDNRESIHRWSDPILAPHFKNQLDPTAGEEEGGKEGEWMGDVIDILLIPIGGSSHWSVGAVFFNEKQIQYLDSLNIVGGAKRAVNAIK